MQNNTSQTDHQAFIHVCSHLKSPTLTRGSVPNSFYRVLLSKSQLSGLEFELLDLEGFIFVALANKTVGNMVRYKRV